MTKFADDLADDFEAVVSRRQAAKSLRHSRADHCEQYSTPKHLFLDATILWWEGADQIESTDVELSLVQTQINASRCKQSGNNNGAWSKQWLDTLFNFICISNNERTYFDVLAFAISFCLLLCVGVRDVLFNTLGSNYCSTSNENWLSVAN